MENQRNNMLNVFLADPVPGILPLGLLTGGNGAPDASDYVKPDTKEFYYLSSDQVTVPQNDHGNYDGIVNENGLLTLAQINENVKNNKFSPRYIEEYFLDFANSGPWFPNNKSPFYKSKDGNGCFNSFDNVLVCGWFMENGERRPITTSSIVFYNDSDLQAKWCYTKSKSLYRMGKQVERQVILGIDYKKK